MDLQQEWQNMSSEIITKEVKTDFTPALKKPHPVNLLEDVLYKLKWKLKWLRIIDLPLLVAAFFFKGDLQILLIIVFFVYEIARSLMMKPLNKLKSVIDYGLTTRQVLQEHFNALQTILRIENLFGYVFLPITGPVGLIIIKLYFHETLSNVIKLPNFSIHLLVLSLVGIPLIILTKKMNASIFAKPINNLKFKIKEMEIE